MEFIVNRKELVEAVNATTLKGKYKNAHSSKIGNISDTIAAMIEDNGRSVIFANASDTLASMCKINISNFIASERNTTMFFFEVDKILKYLKTFKYEEINVKITTSNIIIKTERQRAQIPLLIEHSGIGAISKLVSMKVLHDSDEFPTFGKTMFETKIVLNGEDLSDAIKNCSIVGNATYRLNYDKERLTLSSVNFHQTENYKITIPIISGEGEESTLEFSAPLDKFCSGTMFLYLKDDCPILLCGTDRKLIVAPYIRG